ncbi:DNA polymerase IV [Halomonas kashgarensis]|uniref:DNA polymerase IV n=1 Tax=Halomonas kashgarensis TaxID=3084920 RepID=UPI003A9537F0
MRDNPALRDIPLAIGGSVEHRGVISTCNYPARRFGIHSAMSTAQAFKRCPHLTLLRGDMAKYKAVARQVFGIYREVTEVIEPLSLDEAFLDVSGSELCQGSATRIAAAIRQRVEESVGITVSAGVAPNKFLAKIASDWNKPNGMFVITPAEVETFVKQLPVKRINGVGPRTAEKLAELGIVTCADVRAWTLAQLVERFGRFGHRLHELSWGRDERPVRLQRERKSVSTEHTYPEDLPHLAACRERLPELLADLERRYSRLDPPRAVRGAVVKVKFNDFTQTTVEQADPAPDQAQFDTLLEIGWQRGARPVRLLGVGYRLADAGSEQQLTLF